MEYKKMGRRSEKPLTKENAPSKKWLMRSILAALMTSLQPQEQPKQNEKITDIYTDRKSPRVTIGELEKAQSARKEVQDQEWRIEFHEAQKKYEAELAGNNPTEPAQTFRISAQQEKTMQAITSGELMLSEETLQQFVRGLEWARVIAYEEETEERIPEELSAVLSTVQFEKFGTYTGEEESVVDVTKEAAHITLAANDKASQALLREIYLWNETGNFSESGGSSYSLTVNGLDEFIGLARIDAGSKMTFNHFTFEGLPLEMTPESTIEIQNVIRHVSDQVTDFGRMGSKSYFVGEYMDSLHFGEGFQMKWSPETEQEVVKTAVELNNITVPVRDVTWSAEEGSRAMLNASIGLGDRYLESVQLQGYEKPVPITSFESMSQVYPHLHDVDMFIQSQSPKYVLDDLLLMDHSQEIKGAMAEIPSLAQRYLDESDYSGFGTELSGEFLKEVREYIHLTQTGGRDGLQEGLGYYDNFDFQHTLQKVVEPYWYEKFGDVIDNTNINDVIHFFGSAEFADMGIEVLIDKIVSTKAFQGPFHIHIADGGLGISTSVLKENPYIASRVINEQKLIFDDLPTEINAQTIDQAIDALRAQKMPIDFFDLYLKQTSIDPHSFQPTSYAELEEVFEDSPFHSFSDTTVELLLQGFDFSQLPVFSLQADTILNFHSNPQLKAMNRSWFRSSLERVFMERGEMEGVPIVITTQNIAEIGKEYHVLNSCGMGQHYLDVLDFSQLPLQITNENLVEMAFILDQMFAAVGIPLVNEYSQNLVSRGLSVDQGTVVNNETFEIEYAKVFLAQKGFIEVTYTPPEKMEFHMTFQPPQNVENFLATSAVLGKLDIIFDLDEGVEMIKKTAEDYFTVVDWALIGKQMPALDIMAMERLRMKANEVVSTTAGDKLLLELGANMIDQEKITWQNIDEKVKYVEVYSGAGSIQEIDSDVAPLYGMLASFQASKILDFFAAEHQDTDEDSVKPYIDRMIASGVDVPVTDAWYVKLWRNLGNPGRIATKGYEMIVSPTVVRPEYAAASPIWENMPIQAKEGYEIMELTNGSTEIAKVMIGNPAQGARVDYRVKVGGGLTVDSVMKAYPEGSVAAQAVGAYTTGAQKPAELVMDGGVVKNYLRSTREGMVVIIDGEPQIVSIRNFSVGDISGEVTDNTPLDIQHHVKDFLKFTEIAKEKKADIMAGHLLLHKGELAIATNSSAVQDKRRMFVTFADGRFGIVDFTPRMTLYEAALFLQKAGVQSAVNMDTGYYDQAIFYPEGAEPMSLGLADQDGINNKFVLLTGAALDVAQKPQ